MRINQLKVGIKKIYKPSFLQRKNIHLHLLRKVCIPHTLKLNKKLQKKVKFYFTLLRNSKKARQISKIWNSYVYIFKTMLIKSPNSSRNNSPPKPPLGLPLLALQPTQLNMGWNNLMVVESMAYTFLSMSSFLWQSNNSGKYFFTSTL